MSKSNSPTDSENTPTTGQSAQQSFWAWVGAWFFNKHVAWIVLLLTLLVTFLAWKGADEALVQAQQVQFENRTSEVSNAVLRRMHVYEQVLRGGIGLFVASKSVERAEWLDYAASLEFQEKYPDLQGIGFSVHIPAAHLDAHLRTIRAEGFPDYAIRPPGARAEYAPVIYLEPFDLRNQRSFGFDMFSEANRRAAMERARDTADAAISSKVTLDQEADKKQQPGLLMYLPHYKNGAPRNTLAERRANLLGYVYSPIRLNDLMNGILGKMHADVEPDIDIEVYDGTQHSADSLLYNDDGVVDALLETPAGSLTITRHIDLYGRIWSLHFTTRPAFHTTFDHNKPLFILLIGTVLGVMFSGLIWMFATQRRRALKLASQLTEENAEEVAERKRAEAELLRFKNVLDNTLDMIFMFEPESLRYVYVNQGVVLSMGYSREELLGMTSYQIKPLMPEAEFRQLIAPLLSGEQPSLRFEAVHRRKDGTDFPVSIFLQLVQQSDGSSLFVSIVRDITKRKESEQVIWQQANFDTLTSLPNRRIFHDRLEQEIKKSHRSGLPMALMLLDLDRFKEVNDTLGHAQGDVLLIEAARRITECVRESDTVARLGGDEFTVILSEMPDVNSVERIAQNIIERLAAPFQLLQEMVYVSASMGITLYPDDAQTIEPLLKNADQAMYLAKKSGRNRFRYFTAALQEAAQTHLRLRNDLRGALGDKQLLVFYQPIVTLANGAIHKAEALLRWQHPTRGFISPAEFIPVAEETGIIIEIGDWVFREVASQAAHWRASHYAEFQISVNISPVQFRHQGTNFKAWLDYLQELGLPGQSIVMEITEGLLLEAHTPVTDQLLAFRDAGIRVSLDDFGTGYSSLSYLKKFDIDYLKIDQLFVRNLADNANDRILCEAIIVMAHKLGLKVIAEGVETEQQRDLLAAYGCDYAQGWLYSKAVPPEQFEALVWGQAK